MVFTLHLWVRSNISFEMKSRIKPTESIKYGKDVEEEESNKKGSKTGTGSKEKVSL